MQWLICFLIILVASGTIYGSHVSGADADKKRGIISGYLKDNMAIL